MKYLFVVTLCFSFSYAQVEGITVRTAINDFSCFPSNNYDFAFIRGFMSSGQVDPNARSNVEAASKAGMSINVFLRPCLKCYISPSETVLRVVKELEGTEYFSLIVMVYVDDNWSTDQAYNCQYLRDILAEIKKHGKNAAVGSDYDPWNKVMGKNCLVGKEVNDLMWDKHDNKKDIKTFKSFAGFNAPTSKEYSGAVNVCGHKVDLLYLP